MADKERTIGTSQQSHVYHQVLQHVQAEDISNSQSNQEDLINQLTS